MRIPSRALGRTAIDDRLSAFGIELPSPPPPVGNYRRGMVHNGIGLLSGQFPVRNGVVVRPGRLGAELTVEHGQEAARCAALNALAQIRDLLHGFDTFAGLLRVDGMVASAPGFFDQAKVLNGASDLLAELLGDLGAHARSAVGVSCLPMNSAVELVVTFAAGAPTFRVEVSAESSSDFKKVPATG